ncbi:MAG: SRPBCC domain-containing protein [Oricola sp.]
MKENSGGVRSVVIERDIAFPPERIWRALTQPHLIEEWLMKNDFAPVVGHRFNLTGGWGGVLDCEVTEIEPNRTLSYTWNHSHDDPAYDLRSVVTWTLVATAIGTRLRIEQTGFRPNQRQAYGGARTGWERFLDRLEQVVSRND